MKKLIVIIICLTVFFLPTSLLAKEEENKTQVVISFALTKEDRFEYEVKVTGGGNLYDGDQKITNGIVVYELSVGETKEFRIKADSGYEIKEIMNNDNSLATDIEKIQITGVSTMSVLNVRFGKIEEETKVPETPEEIPKEEERLDNSVNIDSNYVSGKENLKNDKNSIVPITGDMFRISEHVCLMLIVLYRIYVSRRGIDTMKRVDNIAISGDIEKKQKTLKEEKEDEW